MNFGRALAAFPACRDGKAMMNAGFFQRANLDCWVRCADEAADSGNGDLLTGPSSEGISGVASLKLGDDEVDATDGLLTVSGGEGVDIVELT